MIIKIGQKFDIRQYCINMTLLSYSNSVDKPKDFLYTDLSIGQIPFRIISQTAKSITLSKEEFEEYERRFLENDIDTVIGVHSFFEHPGTFMGFIEFSDLRSRLQPNKEGNGSKYFYLTQVKMSEIWMLSARNEFKSYPGQGILLSWAELRELEHKRLMKDLLTY